MAEENVDRFARGELSPIESRELGRQALQTPELFEELTYSSVAKRTLFPRRHPRKNWVRLISLATAAAITIALVSLGVVRSTRPHQVPSAPVALAPAATAAPAPVLLARGLARRADSNPVYRSDERQSRTPRASGSVIAIADGTITVDVGSLDGLEKNVAVDVLRDGKSIGTIKLVTIFRERARAAVPPALVIHLNDSVRVPPVLYLQAILDQISVSLAQGDSEGAQRIAEQATTSGDFGNPAAGYEDLNNLGAIAELHGDRVQAQALYQQALQAGPPQDARRTIEANLARIYRPR